MGQRVPASIEIGGCLDARRVDELILAADWDDCSTEWGGDRLAAAEVVDAAASGTTLTLRNAEANYGNLARVTAFCRSAGLAHRYHCAAYDGEWDYETIYWAPGDEGEGTSLTSNVAGDGLITLGALETALAAGATLGEVVATVRRSYGPAALPPLELDGAYAPAAPDQEDADVA